MNVIDALWEQIEPDVFITRGQFERALDGWDIEPVEVDGDLAFAVLTRGPEIHFTSFGEAHPISLAMIKARVGPIMERHGCVTTRTPREGADRQHRFNRAFGFKVAGGDEFFTFYRLEVKCP